MGLAELKAYCLDCQDYDRNMKGPHKQEKQHTALVKKVCMNSRRLGLRINEVYTFVNFLDSHMDIVAFSQPEDGSEGEVYIIEVKSANNHYKHNIARRQLRHAYNFVKREFQVTPGLLRVHSIEDWFEKVPFNPPERLAA